MAMVSWSPTARVGVLTQARLCRNSLATVGLMQSILTTGRTQSDNGGRQPMLTDS